MNLYTWDHFPKNNKLKAFALAETLEEAQNQVLISIKNYPELHEYITECEPVIYSKAIGWIQEVGAELA